MFYISCLNVHARSVGEFTTYHSIPKNNAHLDETLMYKRSLHFQTKRTRYQVLYCTCPACAVACASRLPISMHFVCPACAVACASRLPISMHFVHVQSYRTCATLVPSRLHAYLVNIVRAAVFCRACARLVRVDNMTYLYPYSLVSVVSARSTSKSRPAVQSSEKKALKYPNILKTGCSAYPYAATIVIIVLSIRVKLLICCL